MKFRKSCYVVQGKIYFNVFVKQKVRPDRLYPSAVYLRKVCPSNMKHRTQCFMAINSL